MLCKCIECDYYNVSKNKGYIEGSICIPIRDPRLSFNDKMQLLSFKSTYIGPLFSSGQYDPIKDVYIKKENIIKKDSLLDKIKNILSKFDWKEYK